MTNLGTLGVFSGNVSLILKAHGIDDWPCEHSLSGLHCTISSLYPQVPHPQIQPGQKKNF